MLVFREVLNSTKKSCLFTLQRQEHEQRTVGINVDQTSELQRRGLDCEFMMQACSNNHAPMPGKVNTKGHLRTTYGKSYPLVAVINERCSCFIRSNFLNKCSEEINVSFLTADIFVSVPT